MSRWRSRIFSNWGSTSNLGSSGAHCSGKGVLDHTRMGSSHSPGAPVSSGKLRCPLRTSVSSSKNMEIIPQRSWQCWVGYVPVESVSHRGYQSAMLDFYFNFWKGFCRFFCFFRSPMVSGHPTSSDAKINHWVVIYRSLPCKATFTL